jgi:hypothetical protein
VGDRAPEGPVLGALGVDVDPLVVAGGVGERVDPLLGDLVPVALPEMCARRRLQALDAVDHRRHETTIRCRPAGDT